MPELPIHCVDYEDFPPDFDMVDNKYDYIHFKPLASALAVVNEKLTPVYITYDRSAIRRQYYHTVITKLFIASGTIAVIAATIQLINKTLDIPHIFNLPGMAIEMIAATLAFIAVIGGILLSVQRQWLLDRHKAERIRLLKFGYLIDSRIWEGEATCVKEADEDLEKSLKKIETLSFKDIDSWIVNISIPEPAKNVSCGFEKENVVAFIEYYRKKRVKYQKTYYCKKINQLSGLNRKTEKIPRVFFFLGIIAVLGHFIIDLLPNPSLFLGILSVILVGLAIILPFLGVAVRSFRLSFELSRGAILFKAKYTALNSFDVRLKHFSDNIESDWKEIIKTLWECENFLETEHREWLLLIENSEYLVE
ncbi:MAG: hypothetical protein MUE45_01415 [Methanoregulaceae archaeon]|jgi:hypothetical protein|nr:hypothetical protein [Methanoregulaceae archaeon]